MLLYYMMDGAGLRSEVLTGTLVHVIVVIACFSRAADLIFRNI